MAQNFTNHTAAYCSLQSQSICTTELRDELLSFIGTVKHDKIVYLATMPTNFCLFAQAHGFKLLFH